MLRLLASVTVYCFRGGTFSENFKLVRESGLTTRLARKIRFKIQMARALAKSFRRASRSAAVQVTGSANALSRWDWAQAH